jgi:hypothetical protein
MVMIVHQTIGVANPVLLQDLFTEEIEKGPPIFVI